MSFVLVYFYTCISTCHDFRWAFCFCSGLWCLLLSCVGIDPSQVPIVVRRLMILHPPTHQGRARRQRFSVNTLFQWPCSFFRINLELQSVRQALPRRGNKRLKAKNTTFPMLSSRLFWSTSTYCLLQSNFANHAYRCCFPNFLIFCDKAGLESPSWVHTGEALHLSFSSTIL